MRIGIIAPPWLSVPPQGYGGTEMMLDRLARGLQEAGHQVRLFTTGDSTCPVERGGMLDRGPPCSAASTRLTTGWRRRQGQRRR